MKILTICPTYNRAHLCKKMLASWHETISNKHENTIALGMDISDPSYNLYPKNANQVFCKANSTVTEIINSIWKENQEYDFYHITNDDVIYQTKDWDSKMVHIIEEYGDGIAYGNDLFQKDNLPTFPFISSSIIKSLGWLQLPNLNRYCGDTVWSSIGKECNCIYYLGEVIIEHMHKLAGKGTTDVDMSIYQKDLQAYLQWERSYKWSDVKKVREGLNAKA